MLNIKVTEFTVRITLATVAVVVVAEAGILEAWAEQLVVATGRARPVHPAAILSRDCCPPNRGLMPMGSSLQEFQTQIIQLEYPSVVLLGQGLHHQALTVMLS